MEGLNIMSRCRATGSMLCVLLFLVWAQAGWAQQKEKRITLAFANETLSGALQKIEAAGNCHISFNYEGLKHYRVTAQLHNATVDEALKTVIGHLPLTIKRERGFITISPQSEPLGNHAPASECELSGHVSDEAYVPLAGVHIFIEELRWGTSTDTDGRFRFSVKGGNVTYTMRVSFIGMETVIKKIHLQAGIVSRSLEPIVMKESGNNLTEVVVTGYQTMNRRESASAVSILKASDIMMQGVPSVDQMLQGSVSGMTVINTSGEPSATPKIRIRGNATVNGNKSPVWVVDGVILEQDVPFTASDINSEDAEYLIGNAISGINPQDIESITVLKDASATAIYGVKAANGVIVVSTKRGRTGKPVITYNGNLTLNTRPGYNNYSLMNSRQRVLFSKQLVESGFEYGHVPYGPSYEGAYEQLLKKAISLEEFHAEVNALQTRNTDWFNLLFRNSITHTHSINVSGGTDKSTYYVSAGYSDMKGSARGSDSQRFNTLTKYTATFNSHISLTAKIDFASTSNTGYSAAVNPFQYAYGYSRTIPARHADGNYYMIYPNAGTSGTESIGYNILNELEETGQTSQMDDFNALMQLDVNLLKGLKYTGTFSLHNSNTATRNFATERSNEIAQLRGYDYEAYTSYDPQFWQSALPYGGRLGQNHLRKTGYTIRNQMEYVRQVNEQNNINLMIGTEARRNAYKGVSSIGYGWVPEFGEQFNPVMTEQYIATYANTRATDPVNTNTFTQVASFFGVLSYVYADRYVLNANIRSDGSNKFGSNPKYRWLPTWSFAAKWNLMNEPFMKDLQWIDVLALRGSYGIQGNIHEDATPYLIVTAGNRDDVLGLPISNIIKLPNPDLRWEKTHSWNAALDFTLLNGALHGGIDIYGKNTSDLIMSKSVASSNGRSVLYYNAGKMTNKGVEGFINARLLKTQSWEWRMGANFGRNVNEIIYANPEDLNDTEIVNQMLAGTLPIKGKAIGTLYSYRFAGLNQETGLPMFYTKDGRLSLYGNKNQMELVACGSIFPKLTGGVDTQLNYRRFSLSLNFTYSIGSVARLPEHYLNTMNGMDPLTNLDTSWLRCWKQSGDPTDIPAPYNINRLLQYLGTESGKEYKTYDHNLGNESLYCAEMYAYSDRQVAKADYLKLKMVALSYNFPTAMLKRCNLSGLMLRLQATNLFTLADRKWNGLDPESGITHIPALPTYSLGVNISF